MDLDDVDGETFAAIKRNIQGALKKCDDTEAVKGDSIHFFFVSLIENRPSTKETAAKLSYHLSMKKGF